MSDYQNFPPPQPPPQFGYGPPPPVAPPLAGWWQRVGATLLDGLIAIGFLLVPYVGIALLVFLSIDDEETAGNIFNLVSLPLSLAWAFLYYPLTMKREGQHNGQTWGKQAVGIRVVREDGYAFAAQTAIVREVLVKYLLFGTLGTCLCGIPTLLNFLWPLWDERNQALHDKIANTLVVRA